MPYLGSAVSGNKNIDTTLPFAIQHSGHQLVLPSGEGRCKKITVKKCVNGFYRSRKYFVYTPGENAWLLGNIAV